MFLFWDYHFAHIIRIHWRCVEPDNLLKDHSNKQLF